ncbi:ArsA-related P-loop ATPase [Streptomyces sp. HNM0645]|uniref:ArsA family ATPase n=1 Tax=Streptomyces sp. HNM0645 TaxID=2782343 RepID=UPI0024B83502|nr:ArsA-related P-loop ATPase [Streptomyces sp. HNM0645]MDI9888857.1 ArsA-related P-loop ATPase [Streptomyces sp. HNM0645]
MRTVFVTGTGGAGRSTVAAALALAGARRGERVLLLSDEPSEALTGTGPAAAGPDSSGSGPAAAGPGRTGSGGADTPVPGPTVVRVDSGTDFRHEFLTFQERAGAALDLLGAAPFEDGELTELPGSEQFALLRALRHAAGSGHDLLVVDLPPVRRAVALLALPEQLRRYLRRLLPAERQAARSLRPVLAQLAGVPMPAQWLYETAARWDEELAAVQALVESPATSVRLVAEPGSEAADRALRTARLGLALHGPAPDMVIANRIVPVGSADPFLGALSGRQQGALKGWREEFGAVPVLEVPHAGRGPRQPGELAELLDGPAGSTARAVAGNPWTVEDRRAEDGVIVWRLPLPGASRDSLQLVRRDDELFLTVGPFRRVLLLPSVLRRCTVSGAALRDGELRIRFEPDPGLWPRGR